MSDIPGGAEIIPGGANSGDPVTGSTPVTPPAGETLMYCALPLAIGLTTQPGQAQTRLDWKQFQTGPLLVFLLQDGNGAPMNLTGALSVTLRIAPVFGGTVTSDALTPLYAAGGQFGYTPLPGDVATAGTFQFDIEVVDASGNILYFPSDGTVLMLIHPSLGGP